MNPFSEETIIELEELDIYVVAASYQQAVEQVQTEVGYIWDAYIINQLATDSITKNIALNLSEKIKTFECEKVMD